VMLGVLFRICRQHVSWRAPGERLSRTAHASKRHGRSLGRRLTPMSRSGREQAARELSSAHHQSRLAQPAIELARTIGREAADLPI
jgi:hypothetical protein